MGRARALRRARRRALIWVGAACTGLALLVAGPGLARAQTITEFSVGITPGAEPAYITQGDDGNLWFTEFGANKIGKITPEGVVTEYVVPTLNSAPAGITGGPDGNVWFTEYWGDKIGKITPAGAITEYGGLTGSSPWEIAVGGDGHLWFAELSGSRMGKITVAGAVTDYAVAGGPQGVTQGPGGDQTIWFTENLGHKFGKISEDGTGFTDWASPSTNPESITLGPDGNLWFTTSGGVSRSTPAGVLTNWATGWSRGITVGPDGSIWFAERAANKIGRITMAGVLTEFSVGITPGSGPHGITTGPDGNIWFTERDGDRIGRLTPAPALDINPTSKDFGAVNVGSPGAQVFTLTNSGVGPLSVSDVAATGGDTGLFVVALGDGSGGTCGPLPITIAPGNDCTITVTFTPDSAGSKDTTLRVASNDTSSPMDVALSGNGVAIQAIPTVSEWGMLILGLGMAGVMAKSLSRDRRVA